MRKATEIHDFQCLQCNHVFPLARKCKRRKKVGHIKDLYCFKCKEITKHIENY